MYQRDTVIWKFASFIKFHNAKLANKYHSRNINCVMSTNVTERDLDGRRDVKVESRRESYRNVGRFSVSDYSPTIFAQPMRTIGEDLISINKAPGNLPPP